MSGKILFFILAISVLLRVWGLAFVPPELFGDEVDVGYQAFSLLKTGRDLYGQPLPAYLHSLSEWRAPLAIYSTVPGIFLFGNTALAVRLPSALFGTLSVISIFLLVYVTTRSAKISLLSSLVLSLAPWHIHYSRTAFEVSLLLLLLLTATTLYLKRRFVLSLLLFALSIYCYSTAVVFTPLWLAYLVFYTKKFPSLKSILVGALFVGPWLFNLFWGSAGSRFGLISIFSDPETVKTINSYRSNDPSRLTAVFHNRPETWLNLLFSNYLRAFSSEFLFIKGDPNLRHGTGKFAVFISAAFFLLMPGLAQAVRTRRFFWLVWLGLAPLASALTLGGGYHATRLILMLPPLAVLIGWGLYSLRTRKIVQLAVIGLSLFQLAAFLHYYFVFYARDSWRFWHYGYRSMVSSVMALAPEYNQVFINNTYEPALIRFLFYSGYSPAKFHAVFKSDQVQPEIHTGYSGFKLEDKWYFGSFTDTAKAKGYDRAMLPRSLYVLSARDDIPGDWDWRSSPPAGIKLLDTIVSPTGQPIFYLVTKE